MVIRLLLMQEVEEVELVQQVQMQDQVVVDQVEQVSLI